MNTVNILYVGDDTRHSTALPALLGKLGYNVLATTDAEEAIRLARASSFDLFLFDSRFLDKAAPGLYRRIHIFDPYTPILFFSLQDFCSQQIATSELKKTISRLILEKDTQRKRAAMSAISDQVELYAGAGHI